MISTMKRAASLAGLAVLISSCATDPLPPSLPTPQFIVSVKGETGPVKAFEDYISGQIATTTLKECVKTVPPSAREAGAKSDVPAAQLVYQCSPTERKASEAQLEVFARAYAASTASLLEMKVTTAGCVARSCYGGALRLWYQSPPCLYPC